ncbi:MAG: 16S rRNA (guanine(527)-N(7))-methyltransferase RsmG [Bacteroidetes bacterium]|nr:16S rRNA (guanine(527)-N(7))-methyltransferase RsmG [Bacteroidota bacterium]MCA6444673.1 16S rRNA (guanine(527)-N(7))-methyltransferase RsmG [Bacteroidota bacterium]
MEIILKYFQNFTPQQQQQFAQLQKLYQFWNEQINVISRKDIEFLYERHVLHSLGIAKVIQFKNGTEILDVGTGGGFPGIPLAIAYPECKFVLVDSIGKKTKVVNEVASALGLKNITAIHCRAEDVKQKFDFIVSRAVTEFPVFYNWVKLKINKENKNNLGNGILYLKGGDLEKEFGPYFSKSVFFNLSDFFREDFFETKKVVYYRLNNGN